MNTTFTWTMNGKPVDYDTTTKMVSLTSMWLASGADPPKKVAYWSRLKTTVNYVKRVAARMDAAPGDVLWSTRGRNAERTGFGKPETWAVPEVAITYAQFLGPDAVFTGHMTNELIIPSFETTKPALLPLTPPQPEPIQEPDQEPIDDPTPEPEPPNVEPDQPPKQEPDPLLQAVALIAQTATAMGQLARALESAIVEQRAKVNGVVNHQAEQFKTVSSIVARVVQLESRFNEMASSPRLEPLPRRPTHQTVSQFRKDNHLYLNRSKDLWSTDNWVIGTKLGNICRERKIPTQSAIVSGKHYDKVTKYPLEILREFSPHFGPWLKQSKSERTGTLLFKEF